MNTPKYQINSNTMKKVILKRLTLKNWRGERNRTTNFDPICTTIAGCNGLGKSRHFDAFMWLLFGKDKQGRKDFNVKTVVNGQPLQKTNSEVEGVLSVDGEEITLRRTYVEEWVKPRGQVEQVFKGNKTECYWDEAPVSVTEYQKRVNGIIDDNVFKMVTDPSYFLSMPWKQQRDMLFEMAGTVSDEEIAGDKPEFAALLERIKGKGFDDFKRELSARKKRLKADLAEVQPRIDQTQRLMPAAVDFTAIERELQDVETEIEKVDKAMTDVSERLRQKSASIEEQQKQINALKTQQKAIILEAKQQAMEDAYTANATRRELEHRIEGVKREIYGYTSDEVSAKARIERLEGELQKCINSADAMRDAWYKENAREYAGETTCSCCGQPLPEAMLVEARAHFNAHKGQRLAEITEAGKGFTAERERVEQSIAEVRQDLQHAIDKSESCVEQLHNLKQQLKELPEVKEGEINRDDIAAYKVLSQQIGMLEAIQLENQRQVEADSTEAYIAHKRELTEQRDIFKAQLADRQRIAECEAQVAELETQGRTLSQLISDAEREEYVIQQFTMAKIDECEKRINTLFTMVTFRLYEFTIEDAKHENPIETCIPIVNGVPFTVANTASQVNAGLDVINALSRFYDISAPTFIDGRESVNEITRTNNQIVNLVVTNDKKLVVSP